MARAMMTSSRSLLFLALFLPACSVPGSAGDDDDATAAGEDVVLCHGDALLDDVPLNDDLDELRTRWDLNKELLRILFVGEPF